jgi:hypothetical protein
MSFEDRSLEATIASEAARRLLQYFRPKETEPGTTGTTGTAANKLATSMGYRDPVSARVVPGHISEREPATTENGNKNAKQIQRLGSEVPVVPAVPDDRSRSSNSSISRSFNPERAAIRHNRGTPRAWAEGTARLLDMPAPPTVTAWRWQVFIEDCYKFLDRWGTQAASLGWGAMDLFGMSTACPLGLAGNGGSWLEQFGQRKH